MTPEARSTLALIHRAAAVHNKRLHVTDLPAADVTELVDAGLVELVTMAAITRAGVKAAAP